jgi:hypothetical protein
METLMKKGYNATNEVARSPTLQTVLMVEKFVDENSGAYKKTGLFNALPRKVMWQTFQVIMEYLEEIGKIAYDNEGYVVYIWNPKLVEKYRKRRDLEWNAK